MNAIFQFFANYGKKLINLLFGNRVKDKQKLAKGSNK